MFKAYDISWKPIVISIAIAVSLSWILMKRSTKSLKQTAGSDATNMTKHEYIKGGLNELDASFQVAVDFIASFGGKCTNEERLTIYAFFKQAHMGPCKSDKPSAIDMVNRAKWESWSALGDMSPDVAKEQYIATVKDIFPHFNESGEHNMQDVIKEVNSKSSGNNEISMWTPQSMPQVDTTTKEWQVKEDPYYFASIGEINKIKQAIDTGFNINAKDDEGRTMLHWAVDRSQLEVAKYLLENGSSPNVQDEEGMTPLHYAASCEYEAEAKLLMSHGARVDIEDNDNETPLSVAASDTIEAILRTPSQNKVN